MALSAGSLARDARYATRMLLRSKGFTITALLCLALGIGASTTIFSVVHAVLLKPLPYRDSDRLVRVYTEFPAFPGGGLPKFPVSAPEFREMQRDGRAWDQLEAYATGGANLSVSGTDPVRVNAGFLSGGLLAMLGIQPRLGRLLTPEDDADGRPVVVVLSHGLWQRTFGGDPNVIGREIYFDGARATVAGVMPQGFEFPPGQAEPVETWAPLQLTSVQMTRRAGHFLSTIAHLRPGYSLAQARQEVARMVAHYGQRTSEKFHTINPSKHPVVIHDFHGEVIGNVRKAMLMLLGAVGFFLLIACVNVANLLLARSDARQREIAVRTAVGAGTPQLIRQFLVEGVLLSSAGALLGIALAGLGIELIQATNAGMIPRIREAGVELQVLLFTIAVTLTTGLVFGLAPVLHLIARPLNDALRASSGRTSGSVAASRFRNALVAAELSLALVLLIGAGLLVRGFWKLQQVDAGIQPSNLLTMRVTLSNSVYNDPERLRSFWTSLSGRLAQVGGLQNSTIFAGLPPERLAVQNDTEIENFLPRPGGPNQNVAFYQVVGDRFFETLGIRLVDGRFFDARDTFGATPVVIVNQSMARSFWPGETAIGKRLRPSGVKEWMTVVGVVADVKNAGLDKPVGTEIFLPARQLRNAARTAYVTIRARGDSRQYAATVRNLIRDLDPTLPVAQPLTMEEVFERAQSRPRFLATMLTLFSSFALALAAFGIYGVISYSVSQRTTEFGIRMALGAQTRDVLALVMRQGFLLATAGVFAGAAGALFLTRALDGLLFGVSRFDAWTFGITAAVLACVTLLASWVPAQRATAVDPAKALKYE